MKLVSEPMAGVKVFRPFLFDDDRGSFVKPFHEGQLASLGIEMHVREHFFTSSAKGVLRGMHFQIPPHQHQKLVYCISGRVLDVVLDLRKNSLSYGRAVGVELSAANRHVIHVPVGFAHGFLSLEDRSCLVYTTDSVHASDYDKGVLWDSFDFEWPSAGIMRVISDRDRNHPPLAEFNSPF